MLLVGPQHRNSEELNSLSSGLQEIRLQTCSVLCSTSRSTCDPVDHTSYLFIGMVTAAAWPPLVCIMAKGQKVVEDFIRAQPNIRIPELQEKSSSLRPYSLSLSKIIKMF